MKPRVVGTWAVLVALLQLGLYLTAAVTGDRLSWLFYFDPRWGIFFLQAFLFHSEAFPSAPLWLSAVLLLAAGVAVLRDKKWMVCYSWLELALSAPTLAFIAVVIGANRPANDGFSVRELFFGPFPVFVLCSVAPFCIARQYLSEARVQRGRAIGQSTTPAIAERQNISGKGQIEKEFWKSPKDKSGDEQAVLVMLPLHGEDYGSIEEREAILALADQLADTVSKDGTGEFDGEEFGRQNCTLYLYGPDADNLFSSMEPYLRAFHPGLIVIKRYGAAGSLGVREARLDL